ncbi:MAG TPA: glycosyltransferase family A protein, partial [Kofleriaceae bacterium]|nr:glycosyltransferase family A protein [Kofleriaceae bacterium]
MPAYNVEHTLGYAIDSVLAQSVGDLELIIVDDASTDATPEIANGYAARDSRVIVISNPRNSRQGPVQWESRNDGLRIANGQYIAYLDADNAWHPSFVERLAGILEARADLQLVHCDSRNFYSPEHCAAVIAIDKRNLLAHGDSWTIFSYAELDVAQLGIEQYVDTNEMMHRTSVFHGLKALWSTEHPRRAEVNRHQGGKYPYRRHNDLDLFERIVAVYGLASVYHLREPHVDYYYPSFARPPHSRVSSPGTRVVHPATRANLENLYIARHRDSIPEPREAALPGFFDFGVGEIEGVPGTDIGAAFERFAALDT